MIISYNFCHFNTPLFQPTGFYAHHQYVFTIRLRVRLTICSFTQTDKTLILGERFYNLFYVTHIGIIYFDTIKNNNNLSLFFSRKP